MDWVNGGRRAAFGVGLGVMMGCSSPQPFPLPQQFQVLSDVYVVDQPYRSMQGPSQTIQFRLGDEPKLVWVTGFRAEVVDADGVTILPPEYMCHGNLSFDAARHARAFGWSRRTANRLFTVSQGQSAVSFPAGYGIPLLQGELLTLTTQVLNHNRPDTTIHARVRVTVEYVLEEDLPEPLVPLYMKSANALVSLSDHPAEYGMASGSHDHHVMGGTVGESASSRVIEDSMGQQFAGHWIVPPGPQLNRTNVTQWMRLSRDERVHFIAVHVHPFAQSVSLIDVTRGDTVFVSRAEPVEQGIGLKHVDTFRSATGVRLRASSDYVLESAYDNTSNVDQEAMSVMYLYLEDREFINPTRRP